MHDENFSIMNKTKSTLPRVSFRDIKNAVLGQSYSLSLVFIGRDRSRKLNASYRDKHKPTNILSFPYDETTGEIFICLEKVRKEIKKFDKSFDHLVGFLFIHGLLHLKGMEHGSTMEKAEEKFCNKFGF
jgi:probable rRNA maturation factor